VKVKWRRWGVFNVIASGGFVIQLVAIAVLTRKLGWSPLAATALGVELAALHNFVGHTRWTWSDHPVTSLQAAATRYLRYQVAKTASMALNVALTAGLVALCHVPAELANVAAVLICSVPNYFLIERVVFRS
jgi:putative flippase GtrA